MKKRWAFLIFATETGKKRQVPPKPERARLKQEVPGTYGNLLIHNL